MCALYVLRSRLELNGANQCARLHRYAATRKDVGRGNYSRENIDLGGTWQIACDPDNEGLRNNWSDPVIRLNRPGPLEVPGIWNLSYPDMEGIVFYRTTFRVPENWSDRAILLHFEGAIYTCQVWVDGQFAGSHEGGYTPFWFDLSKLVQPGREYTLIARVAVPSKGKDVDGINLYQAPLSKHSWYFTYGGLWGQVSLQGYSPGWSGRAW